VCPLAQDLKAIAFATFDQVTPFSLTAFLDRQGFYGGCTAQRTKTAKEGCLSFFVPFAWHGPSLSHAFQAHASVRPILPFCRNVSLRCEMVCALRRAKGKGMLWAKILDGLLPCLGRFLLSNCTPLESMKRVEGKKEIG